MTRTFKAAGAAFGTNRTLTAIAIALMPLTAYADSEPTSAEGLQEIVVTAQKREQNVQDVPVAISAFTGEQLEASGILLATELAKIVPGVSPAGSFGGQNLSFSIRGVTQQDFFVQAESPVAVYVDEGYFANNNAASIGLFDIQRVEILKGPQGTLFGRNATGGAVSITTEKPTTDFEGYATFEYGSYDTTRLEAALGGPISDQVQFRVAGLFDQNSGWVTNTSPTGGDLGGQETTALRAHLAVEPSADAKFLLTGYYSRITESWVPYLSFASKPVTNGAGVATNDILVGGLTGLGNPSSDATNLTVDANDAQNTGNYNDVAGATLRADFNIGPTLTLITDYKDTSYGLQIDDDASPTPFFNTSTNAFSDNFSQEIRLYGETPSFRWYTGLYYLWIHSGLRPDQEALPTFGVYYDSYNRLTTNSESAFAQGEYDLTPQLTVIGGIRVTQEDKKYSYYSNLFLSDGTSLGPARPSYFGKSNATLVPAKIELEYHADQNAMFYAGYSRGAKAGNFNAPFAGGTTFPDSQIEYKPETLDAYEVGEKATLFGGTTLVDSSLFYYDYHNYQAFRFINFSSEVTNNPATSYGGEVAIQTVPVKGLHLGASGSYIYNRVDDVNLGYGNLSRVSSFTPRWKFNANGSYTIPLADGALTLQADVTYTGNQYFSLTNYSATLVPAYAVADARLTWASPDDHYEISVFGNNITDTRYKTVGFDLSGFAGSEFTQIGFGKPQWFGGSATYRY